MTEPLSSAEPLNFYGDIFPLCFEKGLLKCISTTHFLKKDQARIWNIAREHRGGKKRKKERKRERKAGCNHFFFFKEIRPAPSRSRPHCLLTTWYCKVLSAFFCLFFFFFFSSPSSSSFSSCRGKFVFRLHKIAFSYFKQQCMQWKIFHIIYP